MMKKKGCDCMFKKLVMLLCFGILLSFGTVSAQSNDELPPRVIETHDLKYVGIDFKAGKKFYSSYFKNTPLYEKPDMNSKVIFNIMPATPVTAIDAIAFIYPYMGKTEVVQNIPEYMADSYENVSLPQKGDTVYVLYYTNDDIKAVAYRGNEILTYKDDPSIPRPVRTPAIVWYKGKVVTIPPDGIKVPYLNDIKQDIYANYEGIVKSSDNGNNRVLEVKLNEEQYSNVITKGLPGFGMYGDKGLFRLPTVRRNADIWICLKTENGQKGWTKVYDVLLSSNENLSMLVDFYWLGKIASNERFDEIIK